MSLLPDIVDGKIVETAENKLYQRFTAAQEFKEKRKRFASIMKDVKAKKKAAEKQGVDENADELNNMSHNVVSEDFEDSPFADRQPLETE